LAVVSLQLLSLELDPPPPRESLTIALFNEDERALFVITH